VGGGDGGMMFNAILNNISVISFIFHTIKEKYIVLT
jgi:hypothetical protein